MSSPPSEEKEEDLPGPCEICGKSIGLGCWFFWIKDADGKFGYMCTKCLKDVPELILEKPMLE